MPESPSPSQPRTPMPSRPSMPPPPPPKGAKPVTLTAVSMLEQIRRRKKPHIVLPLLFTLGGILVLIAIVVGYVAITAGFYRPSWVAGLYQSPIPTRFIENAPVIESSALEKNVTDALTQQFALHPTSTTVMVSVSERDLTGLAESSSRQLAAKGIQLNHAQVVILPDHLELYAEIQKDKHALDVLGTFVPRVTNGLASLEWQDAKIGSLTVSPAFAQSMLDQLLGSSAASIRASFGNATLQSIQLDNGNVELVFQKK